MEGNVDSTTNCPKKPCKGILKTSRSFDKSGASFRKSAKFDELNVLQTFHPVDKDYGHMRIDEPKTPYNYVTNEEHKEELDAELLAEKLRIAANTQSQSDSEESDEEHIDETPEEKERRREFERRRKAHYKEFEAVKLARKLIEEELKELEDDDNDDDDGGNTANESKPDNATAAAAGPSMDIDAQSSSH